ncbi:hypothetical protein AVEN_254734-1 [Araneus ventricosus]|uniref:CCHC-type domain-containing protein n=1 Tax=Araneus ventricosus TaxID=182803 RepID=A0A4Y2FHH8_ARAVE|nr:hypothetical protein AVEN_254734-1 [Araneus ventricosus]
MTEDGRSRSSLSETSDYADSTRSASWYAAVEASRQHTEEYVKRHFSGPVQYSEQYQKCMLMKIQEDLIDKNQQYAQNCRAAIKALKLQGNNEAVIESRLHELNNYEEKIRNSEAVLKDAGPCPIMSCPRHHSVIGDAGLDYFRKYGKSGIYSHPNSIKSQSSDLSPTTNKNSNQDNFIPVPPRKAAKISIPDPTLAIPIKNKFAQLSDSENLAEMEDLTPKDPPKIPVPSINLKLSEDYNLTLQEICRQFPKTDNKYSRGFIQITPNSLDERLKIIDFLNQSGKEYILSESPENRPVKIVIKGLPETHNKELIIKELEENHFKVIRVNQLRNFRLKCYHPIFLIEISKSPKINDVFQITRFNKFTVEIEKYRQKRKATMCYNCSEFFHSAKNCKCKPRCIKCGEPHETRLCPIREKIENPTCINCKESGHVASWRGCPKYPVIKTIKPISYADKLKRNLPNAEKPVKNNQENFPTLQAQNPEFPDLEKN